MSQNQTDVLIIGAGMTGLILAEQLKAKFPKLLILDKSRGVGGRLATRRFKDQGFDTGAQFMRARSEAFKDFLNPYLEQQVIKLWKRDEHNNPMYWGVSKMTDLPKTIAKNHQIIHEAKVNKIAFEDELWYCHCENGTSYLSKHLVITAPSPQCLDLLDVSNIKLSEVKLTKLKQVEYRITLGLLAHAKSPSSDHDVWIEFPDSKDLERCVSQSQKGVASLEDRYMFHFTHEFSKTWIDREETKIQEIMIELIEKEGYDVIESQVKKWRYADPFTTFGELCYQDPNYPYLYLGGDAFGGGSVEGTWRSAMALSQLILKP